MFPSFPCFMKWVLPVCFLSPFTHSTFFVLFPVVFFCLLSLHKSFSVFSRNSLTIFTLSPPFLKPHTEILKTESECYHQPINSSPECTETRINLKSHLVSGERHQITAGNIGKQVKQDNLKPCNKISWENISLKVLLIYNLFKKLISTSAAITSKSYQ